MITFLVVLAHFFGHSLRSLLFQRSAIRSGDTVGSSIADGIRSPDGVFGTRPGPRPRSPLRGPRDARRSLSGSVCSGQLQKIEELRRDASWQRVDGNLVAANEQTNRADDLEALAKEQSENMPSR